MPQEITLAGLDGSNPLGMLAALGAFRIATLNDEAATMHWINQSGWRPVIRTARADDQFVEDVLLELHRLAGAKAREKRVAELRSDVAKLVKERDRKGKKAPSGGRLAEINAGITTLNQAVNDLNRAAVTTGVPFIAKHDLVAVSREEFRHPASELLRQGEQPTGPSDADFHAALACDGILREKKGGLLVEPTPFSFSNGGSGKCLLKDFRSCAAHTTRRALHEILAGQLRRTDQVTSLLWDPLDQQSYALRWTDPGSSKSKALCNAAANALAFPGLTALTTLPSGGRLAAIGMDRRNRHWTWPIWGVPIDYHSARSLLAMGGIAGEEGRRAELVARGIRTLYSSRRFFLNKRPFFSPSKAV